MLLATSIIALAASGALLPVNNHSAAAAGSVPGDFARVRQIDAVGSKTIGDSALRQIQALNQEKETRTPAQQKIDSRLLYVIKKQRGDSLPAGLKSLKLEVGADEAGMVIVDIRAIVDDALIIAIKQSGGEVYEVAAEYHQIRAKVALDQLEHIASLRQVRFIMPQQKATTNQRLNVSDEEGIAVAQTVERFPRHEERLAQLLRATAQASITEQPQTNLISNGYAGTGAANSEGDLTHGAYSARGTFNVDGTGIRIGVLSDGVHNLAASQASGDLPPTCSSAMPPATEHCVNIVSGQAGTTGDEGTAMMEIIHDIAPGAQLYFATAYNGSASYAANIRALRNTYNCDIILDDVDYLSESPFQDGQAGTIISNTNGGIITQAVNDVVDAGASYFSAAGNSGNQDDGTSGTYEGDFVDGGSLALVPGGTVHNFGGGQQFDVVTSTNGDADTPYTLFWSDPLGSSGNDYDLYALNSANNAVIDFSNNTQAGAQGQDPIEAVTIPASTVNAHLVILKKPGAAARFFHLDTSGGLLSISTAGNTHGHSAASGAYGVAATPAYSSFKFPPPPQFGPYPGLFSSMNVSELYSSDGPRRIFYYPDSTLINGDVSSNGGAVLQQPLITAADGVEVTGAGGFPNPFFGTSAATPHAAAIAALLKAAGAYTQAQIKTALTSTAIDIETAGTDRDTGAGIVMPYAALQSLGATGKAFLEPGNITATELTGNGNSLIEPSESGTLSLTLRNTGLLNATGITTTLTTSTPNVTILNNSSAYPNLTASGGAGANATAFTFKLGNTPAEIDKVINFTLTINYAGGWNQSQVINFTVQAGRQPITTTLDTTAPTTSMSFPTTSTGTQPGRLNSLTTSARLDSSCATANTNPGSTGSLIRRWDSYTIQNFNNGTTCVSVSVTPGKAATGLIMGVAYQGSFDPANPGQNYLADFGYNQVVRRPGYPMTMSFNLPAGQNLVLVVNEVNGSGAPDSPYTLQVSGLALAAAPFNTTTAVTSSQNPSNGGDNVTFTAIVSPISGTGTPTGTVQFRDGQAMTGTPLGGALAVAPGGNCPVGSACASVSTSTLAVGSHQITAEYSGDATFNPSAGTLAGGQVVNSSPPPTAHSILITEFRFRGTAGANDEFIELYNNTDSGIAVSTADGSNGWSLVASDGAVRFTVPFNTIIPARGHYLIANNSVNGYSLSNYPAGNQTTAIPDGAYTIEIPDNSGIVLYRTSNPSNFTFANALDAVGFGATSAPYSEGMPLPSIGTTPDGEYSFVRKVPDSSGIPQDTNNNSADFVFIATDAGTYGTQTATLGSPGPENRSSPTVNNKIAISLIDPLVSRLAPPNLVRNGNGNTGTLTIRRHFTNQTGTTITRLRFRVFDITTLNTPVLAPPQADLRLTDSTDQTVSTTLGMVTVKGTQLEQSPMQALGGGLNSSMTVALPTGGLANGNSLNVQFLMNVVMNGRFRFFFIVEALS